MTDVIKGSTDIEVKLRALDAGSGQPYTSIAYNSAGISLWYRRYPGGAVTAITPANLSALTDAHSDGGFKHESDGYCRLDAPDAAFASGSVIGVEFGGSATGVVFQGDRIDLVDATPSTNYSLLTNGTYGLNALYTLLTHGTYGLSAIRTVIDNLPSASTIASAVWASAGRTLTSYGTLVSDIWAASTAATASALTTLANKFEGITLLANWLRAMARSDTPDATALSEINDGVGDFSSSTDALEAIRDQGVAGDFSHAAVVGPGSIEWTVLITDDNDIPLDGVAVWVSTDSAGANVIAGTLYTDAFGEATFMLDAGTCYLWKQLAGYDFTNPVEMVVS